MSYTIYLCYVIFRVFLGSLYNMNCVTLCSPHMCLSPVRIKNLNYKSPYKRIKLLYDTQSPYINVPCGHCKQCIAVRQMYMVQRFQMEALDSHLYFTTLTYDNDHLPKITTSSGYDIAFVDYRHVQNMIKRLRIHNAFGRPFRYFAVSERGSEKHRPHVHILWFLPKYDHEDLSDGYSLNDRLYRSIMDNWVVNVGSDRNPIYNPLFTFHQKFFRGKLFTNYDTHFVVPSLTSNGLSSVAYYVCKYMLKASDYETRLRQALHLNLSEEEYEAVWNMVKSRSFSSKHFGLNLTSNSQSLHIVRYLRECIDRSDTSLHYPQYFNPDTGQAFPLAPYYKRKGYIYNDLAADAFFNGTIHDAPDFNLTEALIAEESLASIRSKVEDDLSITLDFLFD